MTDTPTLVTTDPALAQVDGRNQTPTLVTIANLGDIVALATPTSPGLQAAQGKRIEQATLEPCQYATTSALVSRDLTSATGNGKIDLAGRTTAAAERLLDPFGATATVYAWSGTTWVVDGSFVIRPAKVTVQFTTSGPVEYWQTAATGAGTAVFSSVPHLSIGTTPGTAGDGALLATAIQQGGTLTAALNGGGNPIWNFNNAHSLADVDLSTTGLSTTVMTVTLDRTGPPADATHIVTGFAAEQHAYACVMGGRMMVFTKTSTATALVFGFLEFAADAAIYTDASGDVTSIAFSNPRQSKSSDGAALAGAICKVQTAILGSVLLSTAGLYGSGGSLAGATLILTVNGVGPTTLTMPTAGAAYANAAALLAGINAARPGIATQSVGGFLLLQANAFVLGAGTANTPLGLSAKNNMFKISATQPSGVACYATAVEIGVNNFHRAT